MKKVISNISKAWKATLKSKHTAFAEKQNLKKNQWLDLLFVASHDPIPLFKSVCRFPTTQQIHSVNSYWKLFLI